MLLADRGYDSEPHRKALRAKGICPLIAKRRTQHGSGLGKKRYVVERSISHLHRPRRLRTRYDRTDFIHEAFLKIGCILNAWRTLKSSFC
jgi:transposase